MRKKLLLVDDDLELLDLLRIHFKAAGFSITVSNNGDEVLKKARQSAPDLILLDLRLPGMDGFALCEALRRDPATATTPILVFSGVSGEMSRLAGLESGATDFIPKPASPRTLVERIQYWLAQPSLIRPVRLPSSPRPLRMAACTE